MRIALAQINPTVGDFDGNARKILDFTARAGEQGADLVLFPELCLDGYPARDLLEIPRFVTNGVRALKALARRVTRPAILVGLAEPSRSARGRPLHNTAALLADGRVLARRHKKLLPTYDVFDEVRYFEPAQQNHPVELDGVRLGITICEDVWNVAGALDRPYRRRDPVADLVRDGADVVINLSSSPFTVDKPFRRFQLLARHAREKQVPLVHVNQVGGNDELIFDGNSLALDRQGGVLAKLPAFEEALVLADMKATAPRADVDWPEELDAIRQALRLGIRDYVHKCGFHSALVGLSGGIDSAVTAALAAEALGRDRVVGVAMPSRYSSPESLADARELAAHLDIRLLEAPIETIHTAFLEALRPLFADRPADVTEENLQSRIRGTILMALSNKFGHLVLATGNKSELATGYATLYGDTAGALAVLADVPKTSVYRLARRINRDREVIPAHTLERPPSAELRPGQTDRDSLPPYDVLDRILAGYIEERMSLEDLVAAGEDPRVAAQVLERTDRAEYKRRQCPPGLKITSKAFGSGRRMPIAHRFRRDAAHDL